MSHRLPVSCGSRGNESTDTGHHNDERETHRRASEPGMEIIPKRPFEVKRKTQYFWVPPSAQEQTTACTRGSGNRRRERVRLDPSPTTFAQTA